MNYEHRIRLYAARNPFKLNDQLKLVKTKNAVKRLKRASIRIKTYLLNADGYQKAIEDIDDWIKNMPA